MKLQAVIFDLDGVITDTAEYHYRAWQRLADEEGLPFNRQINEQLRGVGRRESLMIILAGRPATEAQIANMTERKNGYYVTMLEQVTSADLLPGAETLLAELRAAGIKIGIGSASKNASAVISRLGIADQLDAVADGFTTQRSKPAPDLFLKAAEMLGVAPAFCAVVEDAAVGIDAALAAGMWGIGLGPAERVGHAHARFENLAGVTLGHIQTVLETAAWTIADPSFDPASIQHNETIFTIGNGHFCVRGSFEEGYPGENTASFMHGLWDDMPINFTELANLPRWWGVDIWANGIRFRLDHGTVLAYRRWLDLRTGVLARMVRWQPYAAGPVLDLRFERFISLADRHCAGLEVGVTVVAGQADLRLRTGLNAHVENTGLIHWDLITQEGTADMAAIDIRTRATGAELAVAMAVATQSTVSWQQAMGDADGQPAVERHATLQTGDTLAVQKFIAVVPGSDEAQPLGLRLGTEPLAAAIAFVQAGRAEGYSALRTANEAEWARFWAIADVIAEGDIEAQVALRFNIFQLLIAAPRHTEHASIGAKTMSGFGYRHHVFWDTEIFMLPMFTFVQPQLARNMLMYRWHNLPAARRKARNNGFEGAQYPWESAGDGSEVTPTWVPHFADPKQLVRIWTGDIEIHITADIAYGALQYWRVTGDDAWMRDFGAEIVLDGARFWASATQLEEDGKYHFRNVIGPDEYHDRIDDNAYTNAFARWHLRQAQQVLIWLKEHHPAKHAELASSLDLHAERLAHWEDVANRLLIHEDPATGLIEQFTGYFELEDANLAVLRNPARTRSMQALLDIEGCARTQILKQPDVLMLQYLLPDEFTQAQVRVNYNYYDPRTDHEHGSSLGPSISAVMACRVGDSEQGYQHFLRAARTDLRDVRHNASDGIHGASAGGLWQAAIFGFAGLRITDQGWETQPRLPRGWSRLAFNFFYRGNLVSVEVKADESKSSA